MVQTAYDALSKYGQPTSTQGKVEWRPEGLAVPIIGFYDLAYETNGIVIDLKTSHTIPSAIKINHARQVALYATCLGDNIDAQIAYVSPKKSAIYHLENTRAHLEALAKAAMTIQRFLSVSNDPMELVSLTVPDLESFYWTDPDTRQAAWDIWKM
jgi:hypothetical protein